MHTIGVLMPESSSRVPASATPTQPRSKKFTVPLSERVAYSVVEAGALLGVGESKAYEMAASGEMPTIRIGRLRRVPAAQFRRRFGLSEPETK
jgi:excisionase family DNA binding protein